MPKLKLNVCVVGEGAFGKKHLESLVKSQDAVVQWLVGWEPQKTKALAQQFNIPHWTCNLHEALQSQSLHAVILTSPTPVHACQAKDVMLAGKHVFIEIPMADNLLDAEELVRIQLKTGLIAMVGHLRRFNTGHQWLHNKIKNGELCLQQLHAQTYFFRRSNINALGDSRNWTDHLLWHHACHAVDLFQYQSQETVNQCFALQGPVHPKLGIAMDMTVGMKTPNGSICGLSLSFNHEGPLGTEFRYICDHGSFIVKNDEIYDAYGNSIEEATSIRNSKSGVNLIQEEFIRAVRTNKEPNASVGQCLKTMQTLDKIEKSLGVFA